MMAAGEDCGVLDLRTGHVYRQHIQGSRSPHTHIPTGDLRGGCRGISLGIDGLEHDIAAAGGNRSAALDQRFRVIRNDIQRQGTGDTHLGSPGARLRLGPEVVAHVDNLVFASRGARLIKLDRVA